MLLTKPNGFSRMKIEVGLEKMTINDKWQWGRQTKTEKERRQTRTGDDKDEAKTTKERPKTKLNTGKVFAIFPVGLPSVFYSLIKLEKPWKKLWKGAPSYCVSTTLYPPEGRYAICRNKNYSVSPNGTLPLTDDNLTSSCQVKVILEEEPWHVLVNIVIAMTPRKNDP